MANLQDDGICVRHWDWSETSQTVSVLTQNNGLIRGLAKGSRREKGAFSGGIELLTRGEIVGLVKPRSELVTLTAWDLQEPYRGLRGQLGSFYAGMYLADLILGLISDQDPHPRVYQQLDASLYALATDECSHNRISLTVATAQWTLLEETGTNPDLDADIRSGGPLANDDVVAFIPGHGGFTRDCGDGWRVRRETLKLIRMLRTGSDMDDGVVTGDGGVCLERSIRLLGAYIEHMTGRSFATLAPLLQVIGRRSNSK